MSWGKEQYYGGRLVVGGVNTREKDHNNSRAIKPASVSNPEADYNHRGDKKTKGAALVF